MHVIQNQPNLAAQCDSFTALFCACCHLICRVLAYIINKPDFTMPMWHQFRWIKQDIEQNITSESVLHNVVTA